MLKEAYENLPGSQTRVFEWHKVSRGLGAVQNKATALVQNDERSGRPSTSHTVAMAKNVRDGFNSDLRLGIRT